MKHYVGLSLLFLRCLTAESDAGIRPPVLGYAYDSRAGGVRPVEGVPGASQLGPVLDLGISIGSAAAASDQDYILIVTSVGRQARLAIPGTGVFSPQPIPGLTGSVDLFSLSPTGASAAFYDSSTGLIEIVTGLPQTPTVMREIKQALSEPVGMLAVSDDGKLLLIAPLDVLPSPFLLSASGDLPLAIPVYGPASAMMFRAHSHDALIADTSGRITVGRNLGSDPLYQVVRDVSGSMVAGGFSGDGHRVFAAFGDGAIVTYNLATGDSSTVFCSCVPTGMYPMVGDSIFRVNEVSQAPLFLFDGARGRVVFVVRSDK